MTSWRPCPGFPDYVVSEDGFVRRIRTARGSSAGRVLRGEVMRIGYRQFSLFHGDGKRHHRLAHRLVCEAWHGPPPTAQHQAAHGDGDRLNNHFTNLRWATPTENQADKVAHGTHNRGERHGMAKLAPAQVVAIRADRRPQYVIAAAFGIGAATVSQIKGRQRWAHI